MAGCLHGVGVVRADHAEVLESCMTFRRLSTLHLAWFTLLGVAACSNPAVSKSPEVSVKPGINEPFLEASDEDIQKFVNLFEGESREISTARNQILAALDVRPGMAVGDIGAGTGLFEPLFNNAVGAKGKVYAVDLSPAMLEHLRKRSVEENLRRVEVVACTETECGLAKGCVDLIFVCDTYHHFEYPQTTLASLKDALRPGGILAIVDFERIPGTSRPWVLNHVRISKAETRSEIELAGFEFLAEPKIDELQENYLILFRRP
jgi:ubiquinone/menaquinone biosynthesis C-methylase UbiE